MLNGTALNEHLLKLCDGEYPDINEATQEYLLSTLKNQGITPENPEFVQKSVYLYTKYCLDNGADVDCQDADNGDTPLIKVARQGNEILAELLLAHHASVFKSDYQAHTPLHAACAQGAKGIVERLLANKAYIHAQTIDNGWFPIHFAIHHPEIVLLLINHGSGLDLLTDLQQTPLHLAAEFDAPIFSFQALLAFDADMTLTDQFGRTPLQILEARGKMSTAVYQLLKEEVNAFSQECRQHQDSAKQSFILSMYNRHLSETIAPSLPSEIAQLIANETRPVDFSDIAKERFFNPTDIDEVDAKFARLKLV